MSSNLSRRLGALAIVAGSTLLVIGIFSIGLTSHTAANRDFIEYWSAGTLLLHHQSPYDIEAILRMERDAGLESNKPLVTLSPPALFSLLLPLGLVGPKPGLIVWSVLILASLLVSIRLIWILNGRPDNAFHYCGLMFAPAVACLMAGQLGTFLLLGVALFLYLHETQPYLAGLALLPCVWKPHLFLPFFLVLSLWSLKRRDFRILFSFCVALAISCSVTLWFDPHVWAEYLEMMPVAGVARAFVPTLSVELRFLINPEAVWLQYIPEALACIWATWYFWTSADHWRWTDQGMLLLLVSALCTPYAWFTDEAMLLPAILSGVYRASAARRSLLPIVIAATIALLEICALGNIASKWYLWTVPAWLAWYLYATLGTEPQRAEVLRAADMHTA